MDTRNRTTQPLSKDLTTKALAMIVKQYMEFEREYHGEDHCSHHPAYKGERKPRTNCPECAHVWVLNSLIKLVGEGWELP